MAQKRRRIETSEERGQTQPVHLKAGLQVLMNRNTHYPVCNRICQYLDVGSLCALTRKCKQFSSLMKDLQKTQWNIDKKLARFFKNPIIFREELAKQEALIAGSFAVQFFDRVVWEGSDLDIFVHDRLGRLISSKPTHLERFLIESEGYTLSSSTGYKPRYERPEYFGDIVDTLTYVRTGNVTGKQLKIQILYTSKTPLQAILRDFYQTAVINVINVITSHTAYSIFPRITYMFHRTYLLKEADDSIGELLAKYRRRGWSTSDVLWPEERVSNPEIRMYRRIGDRYTWKISFNNAEIKSVGIPNFVFEQSEFRMLLHKHKTHVTQNYKILAPVFFSHVLRYQYICDTHYIDSDTPNRFWHDFVGPRVDRMTEMECFQTEESKKPRWHSDHVHTNDDEGCQNGNYNMFGPDESYPPTWTYYDHEIPRWRQVYEEQQTENGLVEEGQGLKEACLPSRWEDDNTSEYQ